MFIRRIDSSWTPTRQNFSGPVPNTVLRLLLAVLPLRLGDETITDSDHVRLLGVTISSDLSIDKQLIRRIICLSLDTEFAKTSLQAVDSSRVNSCIRAGRVVNDHYWSSSACAECSRSGSQRNSRVRPRLEKSALRRTPLAGCSLPYPVQARNALYKCCSYLIYTKKNWSSNSYRTLLHIIFIYSFNSNIKAIRPSTMCKHDIGNEISKLHKKLLKKMKREIYKYTNIQNIMRC